MRVDYLIVGAGFAGSVCAHQLARAGKSVLVIDQRHHLGGNAYDYHDEHGIRVHKFGAHIFHTNNRQVFEYLSCFTQWAPYRHRVKAKLEDGRHVPVPINAQTLQAFGGDEAAAKRALIEPYTRKQWGPYADHLDPTVLARVPTRAGYDDGYFLDKYQAMPAGGYTALFTRLLTVPGIRVELGVSYRELRPFVHERQPTIYTGPIDEYFGFCFGPLPYRSASFTWETRDVEFGQPAAVVNHPSESVPYTRVIEFKRFTGHPLRQPRTTLAYEHPQAVGEPFWPVPTQASRDLYAQYKDLAERDAPHVTFTGRLGSYKYIDMDQTVAQSLMVSRRLLTGHTQEASGYAIAI